MVQGFIFEGDLHVKNCLRRRFVKVYTVKKSLAVFPSPAGMSLTKLSLDGKNFESALKNVSSLYPLPLHYICNTWRLELNLHATQDVKLNQL
jgi:hypothetical protein